jgi:ATP-binding cassette subfamily B protein
LRVQRVAFTYPNAVRPTLREASLEAWPGEIVALTGPNGSGKSTLARIVCGLHESQHGSVEIAGLPVNGAAGPERVAVLFQDYVTYALSARENVTLGSFEHAGDSLRVAAATDAADAHNFLERLPNGYDTLVARDFAGGVDLSIGQRQRLAIARALFSPAPLLVLDEPTAALDVDAERKVMERLRTGLGARAVLLISHRQSTIRWADRVYVIDEGTVIEQRRGEGHDDAGPAIDPEPMSRRPVWSEAQLQ